jgi:hypothetical protein
MKGPRKGKDVEVVVERITADDRALRSTSISFIVATTGRESLAATLASIDLWPGDEILLARGKPPAGDWGHTERNAALPQARGGWLAFMDDDDTYVKGHRSHQADAIAGLIGRRRLFPVLFRMRYRADGRVLWADQDLRNGNVGTPMMLVPNIPDRLSTFGHRFEGDFDFMNSWTWPRRNVVWNPAIIAEIG